MMDEADALLAAGKWDKEEPPCSFCKEVISKCMCRKDLLEAPSEETKS